MLLHDPNNIFAGIKVFFYYYCYKMSDSVHFMDQTVAFTCFYTLLQEGSGFVQAVTDPYAKNVTNILIYLYSNSVNCKQDMYMCGGVIKIQIQPVWRHCCHVCVSVLMNLPCHHHHHHHHDK